MTMMDGREEVVMDTGMGINHEDLSVLEETDPAADSRAALTVRRWLEEAWRHGEVVVDADGGMVTEQTWPPDRFHIHGNDLQ
jgi:hypothetical protein